MKKTLLLLLAGWLLTACASHRELKFISFNIRNSSAWQEDGSNAWQYRRDAVLKMVEQERPDAMGMQEMLPDQLHFLDSALAGDYGRIGVGRDDGMDGGENMCIYYRRSRLGLVDWHTYWLSQTPDSVSFGWDAACRRTATVAQFVDLSNGDTLVYVNTHLDHVGPEARKNSILLLVDICQSLPYPTIIGGDMNSDVRTDSIFSPLRGAGFRPARDMAQCSDTAITFTGYGKYPATVIDHFFVRQSQVSRFRTLNGDYGVPYISDHYPVMMEFRVHGHKSAVDSK
ncbi:MAG: endonuclease/exonuclease/phosphatase family protein [Bacteroidales bacterium]|nr:endonuclease/exonuclease/phosphatase family protein [Bacteroidales bacterium]